MNAALLPLLALLPALLPSLLPSLLPPLSALPVDVPDISTVEAAADSLYVLGEFDAAALEYKRALYFKKLAPFLYIDSSGMMQQSQYPVGDQLFTWDKDTLLTQVKLVLSLYRSGEQHEADAILYSIEGPMVRMVRAILLIEEDNPYLAARAVDSVTQATYGPLALRLRGWAYLEAGDYTQASAEFRKAGDDSLAAAAAVLTKRDKSLRLKNPVTARWLSLIPGLGEAYAGRPLFGLWAFLVNAGDTYLIIDAVLKAHYLDAFLVYTFLWQRFYSGSMANADRFAKEYNERKIAETLGPIREGFGERQALRLDLETLNELHRLQLSRITD